MAEENTTPSWLKAYEKPTTAAPTPRERKEAATTAGSEASASRTTQLTPLEVKEKELAIAEKERKAEAAAAAEETSKTAKAGAEQKRREQTRNFLEDIQRARKLLTNPMATGPAAQLTGGVYGSPAGDLSAIITALKSPIVLEAMQAARAGSKVGATGFGALSGKEMDLLSSSLGSLREGQSREQLLDTLNRIDTSTRRVMAYNAGYDPDKPEGAALVGLAPPKGAKEPPEPTGGDLKAGKWAKNPELVGVDAAVTSMIKGGRSAGEIRQWLNEYQPELGDKAQNLEANIEYWRKTKKDPRVTIERQFVPSESKISALGAGPAGAFTAGAADQILAGTLDELSGDRERTAAVQRGLQETNPLSYTAGQIGGGILSAAVPEGLAAKYGVRIPALMQGVIQNAAYGAGSAEPGERLSGGFYEGVMTPFTNILGNIAGKTIGVPLKGADAGIRRLADKYNINLTPGQMTGGGGAERTLSAVPIVGGQIRARRNETLQQFNKAAFDEGLAPIGARVSAPGQTGIAEAQTAVSDAYKSALGGVTLVPDQTFAQEVRGRAYSDLGQLREIGPELQQEVDSVFARYADPKGAISGESMQMALQDLQKLKTSYKQDPRWASRIAPKLDEISDAYSGLLERQHPENFDLFKRANETYRNVSILENAVENAAEGDIFNPRNLKTATKQGTTRFGGKKASARGERPFNELVMPSLDVVPAKFDDTSFAGRLAAPVLAGGAGVTYGGASLLGQPDQGTDAGEGSGVLPAPAAYGLLGAGLASLPYSRFGNRAMTAALRGSRTPGQQELGRLIEQYLPAVFRGAERGATSEPGVPSPQGTAPLIDPQMQALIDKTAFAEAPQPEAPQGEEGAASGQIIDKATGRPVAYDAATNRLVYLDTGEDAEGVPFAYGGRVSGNFAYPVGN